MSVSYLEIRNLNYGKTIEILQTKNATLSKFGTSKAKFGLI